MNALHVIRREARATLADFADLARQVPSLLRDVDAWEWIGAAAGSVLCVGLHGVLGPWFWLPPQ